MLAGGVAISVVAGGTLTGAGWLAGLAAGGGVCAPTSTVAVWAEALTCMPSVRSAAKKSPFFNVIFIPPEICS
jgi:hypothetical protein